MHNPQTQPNLHDSNAEARSRRMRLFRAVLLKEIKMPAEDFMRLVAMIGAGDSTR